MATKITGAYTIWKPEYVNSSTWMQQAASIDFSQPIRSVKSLVTSTEGTVTLVKAGNVQMVCKTIFAPNVSHSEEARILAALRQNSMHRNIVIFHAAYPLADGCLSIYEEFCTGGDLRDQLIYWQEIRPGTGHPLCFVAHAFAQIGAGLAFMHKGLLHVSARKWEVDRQQATFMHGDIKPENILLRWNRSTQEILSMPDLVLTDFGHSCEETAGRQYLGTPEYLPPEVLENKRRQQLCTETTLSQTKQWILHTYELVNTRELVNHKADIYTFGQVMAELFSGRVFDSETDPEALVMPNYYMSTVQLARSIKMCLQIGTLTRADWYVVEGVQGGLTLLSAVDDARRTRDMMLIHGHAMPPHSWCKKP